MKYLLSILFFTTIFSVSAQKKIAIIGGGISGIASAHYLHKFEPEAQITIFEKEAQLGGNAQTITVPNRSGELVKVDIGPQYFAKNAWKDYLLFLDETIGQSSFETEKVNASMVMKQEGRTKPLVISPLKMHLRGESFSNLLRLRKFNMKAYQVYKNPAIWEQKTVDDWLATLNFSDAYKKEIILPFLAATFGVNVKEINGIAIVDVVKLFAFRKPKISNSFEIMTDGMGDLLIKIGAQLQNEQVEVRTSTPVYAIHQINGAYQLSFSDGESIQKDPEVFDFVVMAVHSDIAAKILMAEPQLATIAAQLNELKHFKMNICIHSDSSFIENKQPSFLNIFTSKEDSVLFHTMNLGMISPRLEGLYKSWLSPQQMQQLKSTKHFIAEAEFSVNMVTPAFLATLSKMKLEMESVNNLIIIGGWTEGLETQNSAVISAQKSLEKYKAFKQ